MRVSDFVSSITGMNEFLALGKKVELTALVQMSKIKKETEAILDGITLKEREITNTYNDSIVKLKLAGETKQLDYDLLLLEKERAMQGLYDEDIEVKIKKIDRRFLDKISSTEEGLTTTPNILAFLENIVEL